jgi:hypothetical protein
MASRNVATAGGRKRRKPAERSLKWTEYKADQWDKAALLARRLRPNANPAETGKKDSTLRRIEHMKNIAIN